MSEENVLIKFESLLNVKPETDWLEFKTNNIMPEELGRIISGLSNAANISGREISYLVFGINDKTHKVEGTSLKKQISNGEDLEHWLVKKLGPRLNLIVNNFVYDGKKILMFEIPAAKDQPTYFGDTAYIRIASITNYLKDYPDKERIIWNNPRYRKFEDEFAITNLAKEELFEHLDFDNYFVLTKENRPIETESLLKIFEDQGFIKKIEGGYSITNLGAILFSRDLGKISSLRRKGIRLIQYEGSDRTKTIREMSGRKGYALAFQPLLVFLNSLLPANEEISEALREERKMYPEIALRELIANSLLHQDFGIDGMGPMVEVFVDRLEITNPGIPIINIDRFIDHAPISRNEHLGFQLRRMFICEERGSGIDKVIGGVEAYQLPAPSFKVDGDTTKVTLFSKKTLKQMSKEDRIRACYQHACLNFVSNKETTNLSLRGRFGIPKNNRAVAQRILDDTIDAGLIKVIGEDVKQVLYKYVPFWA